MRILVFHGYLLRGTGSNVYNASLAAALVRLGHEVHLLCQEDRPWELDFVGAVGEWTTDGLQLEERRPQPRCTVYRPDIGGLLPVYVADRYAGVQARPFPDLSKQEVEAYVQANVRAVDEVANLAGPDLALANHLVMGPAILARALAGRVPYAVKIHGSALEYTVKPHPRFLPFAEEGLAGARGVLVGSRHTAESLWAAMKDAQLPARTRLGPPGVDVDAFGPQQPDAAAARVSRLAERLEAAEPAAADAGESAFTRDPREGARALGALAPAHEPVVAFVGKLILSKGIDLLLAAWPLVLQRVPDARLAVIGFGAFAAGARDLAARLAAGDLEAARALSRRGREFEGGPAGALPMLAAFLEGLEAEPHRSSAYAAAARGMGHSVVFTGRLEHRELADVLPACQALIVPSTFPEAFGMVAAEAAACGALPISAEHSGLAEVSRTLAAALPDPARRLVSFRLGERAVEELAERVVAWLQAPAALREEARAALVRTARDRYSWEGVAAGVIAAAQGRLDELPTPAPDAAGDATRAQALG